MSERISELPSATVLNGTDLIPVVQDGTTKRATINLITAPNLSYSFIVTGTELGLPTSRVLTAGNGITIQDSGAGSTVTVLLQPNPNLTGTAALGLPSGNTSQRPAGSFGQIRANNETIGLEFYDGAGWSALATGVVYVSSVGLSLPSEFTVSGSPVTSAGTLSSTWASATQNYVFAAPSGSSGTPSFRALVAGDIPSLPYLGTTLTSANILVGDGSNAATAVALSGDATLANTGAMTLATVNANVGSFGSASSVATFTADGKGRLTAAGSIAIAVAWSAITSGTPTTVSGYGITDAPTLSGAFSCVFTVTAGTALTLPISGTLATQSYVTGLGYITGNQGITLSGDVSGTGTTAITTEIGANKVTTGMLAQAAGSTILGNSSTSTANVAALTDAQAATVLARYLELAPRWYS